MTPEILETEAPAVTEIPPAGETSASTIGHARTARFVCLAGTDAGAAYSLDELPIVMGRDRDADLVLADREASRRHARVTRDGDDWVIEDLGSSNGTVANGRRVRRHVLQLGDRIQCGATIFRFELLDGLERRVEQLQRFHVAAALAGVLAPQLQEVVSILTRCVDQWPGCAALDEVALEGPYRSSAPVPATTPRSATTASGAHIENLRQALGCLSQIAQEVSDIGRPESSDTACCELDALVAQTLSNMQPALDGITVEVKTRRPLAVRGRAGDLLPVLRSLIGRAREAIPRGGQLSITGSERQLAREEAYALHLPVRGPFIELIVAHGRPCLEPDSHDRRHDGDVGPVSFDEPTGLQWAAGYGIVRSMGGNLLVDTHAPDRACLRMLLPAVGNHANDRRIEKVACAPPHSDDGPLHVAPSGLEPPLVLAQAQLRYRRRWLRR